MSIEAKELRQGNLVKINDLFIRVHKIEEDRFWATHNNLLFFQGQDTSPIPLSEEILLKCNFRKDEELGYRYFYKDFLAYDLDDNCIRISDTWEFGKKHYLHELQNLIYALTGSELEVNL